LREQHQAFIKLAEQSVPACRNLRFWRPGTTAAALSGARRASTARLSPKTRSHPKSARPTAKTVRRPATAMGTARASAPHLSFRCGRARRLC